jgi:hypothetical protein
MTIQKFLVVLTGVLMLTVTPLPASAQVGISTEGTLGITFPIGDLSRDRVEGGIVLGATANVDLHPRFGLYAGLNRHTFSCASDCGVLGENPMSTGVGVGVRYNFDSPRESNWWARLGAVAHQFSSDLVGGERRVGLEAGLGVNLPVNPELTISPRAGVVTHGTPTELDAQYLTFGVGISYQLR